MINGSNNFAIWKKGYWCTMVYKTKKNEKKKKKRGREIQTKNGKPSVG